MVTSTRLKVGDVLQVSEDYSVWRPLYADPRKDGHVYINNLDRFAVIDVRASRKTIHGYEYALHRCNGTLDQTWWFTEDDMREFELVPARECAEDDDDSELEAFSKTVAECEDTELGAKYDTGKLAFGCFTRGLSLVIRALVAVLTYGAQKYKRDSWQTVPNGKQRYEDAHDRHMNAYQRGEFYDDESGLPHLAHAIINSMFVMWFEMQEQPDRNYTTFKEPPK